MREIDLEVRVTTKHRLKVFINDCPDGSLWRDHQIAEEINDLVVDGTLKVPFKLNGTVSVVQSPVKLNESADSIIMDWVSGRLKK